MYPTRISPSVQCYPADYAPDHPVATIDRTRPQNGPNINLISVQSNPQTGTQLLKLIKFKRKTAVFQ